MGRSTFGSVRKLPSGRYQARWTDLDGTPYKAPETFATKRAAHDFLATKQIEQARGVRLDRARASTPIGDAVARYVKVRAPRLKPSTLKDYQSISRSVISGEDGIGDISLAGLERRDVREWISRLEHRGMSPSRIRKAWLLVNKVCDEAVRENVILRNECLGAELPRLRQRDHTVLDRKAYARLRGQFEGQWAVLADLLFYGGLRIGEALALTGNDVDVPERGAVRVEDAKTRAGVRVVFPGEVCMEPVREHAGQRGGLLFTGRGGTPMHYSNWLRRIWRPACDRAGFADLNPHDLRASCATLLLEAGADVKAVQDHLGHADPMMTLRIYAKVHRRKGSRGIGDVWDRTG